VSLLVAQAAVTIETAALIEKDRMMLRRLRMLSAASVEMMDNPSSLRLPERIKLILRNLAVILEAEAASFFRVERPGFLTKRGCYGHVEEDYNIGREFAIKSEPGGGLTGHIAFEAKPFRAHGDDLRNHWAVAGRDVTHVRSGECHSLLALPLLRSQRGEVELVGLLEVENRLGPDGQPDSEIWFTPEDQYLMNVFAQSVLVSLENADLFERTSDQLEKRVHALKTLHDAGTAITGAGSLPDVLRLIVREARELTAIEGEKAQLGYIALLHDRKLELVEADPPELVSELRGRIGTIDLDGTGPIGVVGRVVASGKGELVREPERDPDYIKLRDGIRCLLAMPMSFGQETIGAVVLQHTHPMAFDSGDERDLGLLAAQATIAINNVRRYEELMRVKGLIGSRTALAWMGMVTNHLRHKIQNNIVTCQAKLEQLRRSLPRRDLSPRVEDILEVLDSKLMLILGAPVAPLPLEKAGSVALNHAIAGRLEVLDSTERYRSVECCFETTLPDTATVRAGREWLQKALDVLGDNSVEAMIGCSIQRLSVEITDAGQWAEIRVTDTGRGVSESVQRDLFERPIAKKKVETGLGMGLLMVRLIVETYGGDIRLESPGPGDTTFLIRLPLEQ
jgi:GAF domain-containing protein